MAKNKAVQESYSIEDISLKYLMLREEVAEGGISATNHYRLSEMLLIFSTAAAEFGRSNHKDEAHMRIRHWLTTCNRVADQQMDPIFFNQDELVNIDALYALYERIKRRIDKNKFHKVVKEVHEIYRDVVIE